MTNKPSNNSRHQTQGTHFIPLLRDMGVVVVSPFSIQLWAQGTCLEFTGFLPHFGGPNGVVFDIGGVDDFDDRGQVAQNAGFYYSSLNALAKTCEADVKDTLDDWGYHGPPDQQPLWYTGKSWS